MKKRRPSVIDPDFTKAGPALKRAAAKALQLGMQTNTPVWVIRDGVMVDLVAERTNGAHSKANSAKGAISRKHSTKRNTKATNLKK